jgi:hypothetical protein
MHIAQPLAKPRQAIKGSLSGRIPEPAFILKPFGQAHGFSQPVDDRQLTVAKLANDHVKTIGAEIYGSEDFGGLSIVRPGTCGICRIGFYRVRPYAVLVPVSLNGK